MPNRSDQQVKAWWAERTAPLLLPENRFSMNRKPELIAALKRELQNPVWDSSTIGLEREDGVVGVVSFSRGEMVDFIRYLETGDIPAAWLEVQ